MPSLIIIVASLGDYRLRTMTLLKERLGERLGVYAGLTSPTGDVKTLTGADIAMSELKNLYLPGHILIQNIPVFAASRASTLLLDLNPRVPHVWLLLVLRKLFGKPTLLWGHAWPRSGRGAKSDLLRGLMRRMASGLVCYTRSQAAELLAHYPNKAVYAAPNALISRTEMSFNAISVRRRLVYVGRLVAEKRVEILIPAFERIAGLYPNLQLTIIGDGALRSSLQAAADKSPFRDRISLLGHISDYDTLRAIYDEAIAALSPGYVGLSIIQSLGFGLPMIISRCEPHAPEIEAAEDGLTAVFAEERTVDSFAGAMAQVAGDETRWAARGAEIVRRTSDAYSVEAMVEGLEAALVRGAAP